MKGPFNKHALSNELIAAYLDGNATLSEIQQVLNAMKYDAHLRELLQISAQVDAEMALSLRRHDYLPMSALAAECGEDNLCCLVCEQFILKNRGIDHDEQQLLANAVQNGWLKQDGTPLHNVGRHLEQAGLVASRRYKSTIEDIHTAITEGQNVIVAVDGVKLLSANTLDADVESTEDIEPNHTVVVTECSLNDDTITVFDPNSQNERDTYCIAHFLDAWTASQNYMVVINDFTNVNTYAPQPIDVSDVVLDAELIELREAIAENTHDIWAFERMQEGWTYGPERNDALKQTPCLVPYSKLPESEKEYDRKMAMQTIKLMNKLGYELVNKKK